ncbi:Ubiquitin carboxyl-terminal hydrolase 13 [Chamberlinius hualienensis]
MELLKQCLPIISIPRGYDKIYKDECVYSFDTPESEGGLYVCMTTFFGFGRKYVEWHHKKSGLVAFLHLRRIKKECPRNPTEATEEKKVVRLAIGVEGGFDFESQKKYEYEEVNSIVLLPSFTVISLPNTELPEEVQACVSGILAADSATKLAEVEALAGTWDGEKRKISRDAENLIQFNNGIKVPPKGWKCEECDKVENLWLNLTDGSILCGRKFFDGSGGNNHALEHYKKTGHSLAVKLGTITVDGADVFSYAEDDMVEDPYLKQHLAHFGINITELEKTDKSMIELEIDINQKIGEWATIQEAGSKLVPLYGPGYTGLANLGNSCYLNSVMQVLFSMPAFQSRYFDQFEEIFRSSAGNPTEDFTVQMAKLAYGLLSGEYSKLAIQPDGETDSQEEQPGLRLNMFKSLIGKGHPEFSTKRQQDAMEFLLHLINLLERHNRGRINPADCFKYEEENRILCVESNKVKYLNSTQYILRLPVPIEDAVNLQEVIAYEKKKQELEAAGGRIDPQEIIRARIPLSKCFEAFAADKSVPDFYSSELKRKSTAIKSTRLATFPDFLMIQLEKFTFANGWIPKKLDVSIEIVNDVENLEFLRGRGLQPNEIPLPEETNQLAPSVDVQIDELVVANLEEMGFPRDACKRAVFKTGNQGLEAATDWIMEHMEDPDFNDPLVPQGGSAECTFVPDPLAIDSLSAMGFTLEQVVKALKATDNSLERAADWIFSHLEELDTEVMDTTERPQAQFRDGEAKYRLTAFISHMGTSTMVGHYVCHILKEGRWVIFNDNKVALSENPPKDLGYIYIYKRVSD